MITDIGAEPVLLGREILNAFPAGIWLADSEHRVTFANNALAALLGWAGSAPLIGRNWREFFPPGRVAPVNETGFTSGPYATPECAASSLWSPTTIITRTGRSLPVRAAITRTRTADKTWYLGTIDAAGTGTDAGVLLDPVSRQVLDNSTDAICLIQNGIINYINPRFAELTGYSLEDASRLGLQHLLIPDDRERALCALSEPYARPEPTSCLATLITRCGRRLECKLRIATARTNGLPVHICLVHDIGPTHQARQTCTELTATIAHELRNPLAAIKEAVSLVADTLDPPLPPRPRRYLAIADEEISRLNRMICNLLEVARAESGRIPLALDTVSLSDCVGKTVECMAVLLNKKQLTVETLLPDNLPPVPGDTDRLRLVFNNLLDNAIKYAPTGSRIRISARLLTPDSPIVRENNLLPDTPYIQVVVTDSGPGIPADSLEHVFEKYERINPHGPGIGLGLAIVRSVIELHHGRVWAQSRLGEGTSFNLLLPAMDSRTANCSQHK